MNIDLSTKPKIVVDLPPVIEAYLRYLFKTPAKQKEVVIHRRYYEGKAVYAKVMPVEYPVRRPFTNNPVTIILPETRNNKYVLAFRYYTISKMAEEQLVDDLEQMLSRWMYEKFKRGYDVKGWDQELIVNAILRGFNLRKNAANFEAVKKYDYRNRVRVEEKQFEELVMSELLMR
ncbi:hypothetical protein [Mangrovibacterium sp.]|uniref:hypothetical protein n=1 Tax=Mangrovibacterium sp. TaxID=1961364 RepID=UPI0035697F47